MAKLVDDACASSFTNPNQADTCEACMNDNTGSTPEVCIYRAVHQDSPVTLGYN